MYYINPEIAAHNIAMAFCQRKVQSLPDEAFIPGDIRDSAPAVKEVMNLYATVYDFAFKSASEANNASAEEE